MKQFFPCAQKSVPALLLILSMLLTPGLGLLPLSAGEASPSSDGTADSGPYDFEFKTAASIEGFTADSGEVTFRDGKLVYTLSGTGSRLVSPAISVEPGDVYAARLPLRNTLFVRLKNSTAATQVRVSYTTTESREYSEDKSAVFEVKPNSGYTSYFFNLSDCPTVAEGYLYGFAIEPISAKAGTMEIEAITFEREAAATPLVGTLTSCTATSETVTITGTLDRAYSGKTVTLYETAIKNHSEQLKESEIIAEVKANGTSFTITVPFKVEEMTRLSSLFLLGVEGKRLCSRFSIENYADFSDNPYAFALPDYEVKVTSSPFNAKGDAFTDDTAAIQAAIDHVSKKGGGRVIIPGDSSRYGRRYVATSIRLRDNVDLHLEEGAIIWQSSRSEDYDYEVLPGHDISIPGVNWTHTASCHNLPLIYGSEVKNIKLTGKGLLRMVDTGSENSDSVSANTLWTGCDDRLHLTPVGLWRCENIELSGVGLRRTNSYHINLRQCSRVYVADVTMWEVTCASGDGIDLAIGTKHVTIDRCFLYSNDDAVTFTSSYNDPRGLAWWRTNPDGDNCIADITVRHSNLYGGHGITFITWGTDAPDLSLQEIKNIEVYDCILNGGTAAVGAWPDNPYYGRRTYDNTETNDYSPVKNVRLYNNRYFDKTTLECIKATNVISDCGIQSTTDFRYGGFERKDRRNPDWVTGLSNWSSLTVDGTLLDDPVNMGVGTDNSNHYGYIKTAGILCQGLLMNKGSHTFTVDTRFDTGDAALVVINAATGALMAEQAITPSSAFATQTLTFTCDRGATAYIGVRYAGSGELHMDNAAVTSEVFKPDLYFTENFADPLSLQITNDGFTIREEEDGSSAAVVTAGQSGLMMMHTPFEYKEFDLHLRLRYDACMSTVDANFGISFLRSDGANMYNVNYNPVRHSFSSRVYNHDVQTMIEEFDGDLPVGEWLDIALRVQNGKCLWYINGEEYMTFDIDDRAAAPLAIVAYNINCVIKDLQIAPAGTTRIVGDEILPESDTEPLPVSTDTLPEDSSTAPATDMPTAPSTQASNTEAGCRSALPAGTLALTALLGGTLTIRRKRRKK